MVSRVVLRVFLAAFFVFFLANRASAQLHTGHLQGRVVDPQGSPISGATVTIGGPGGPHRQVTDSSGRFRFPGLPPGGYSIKVERREPVTPVGHPNVTVRAGRTTEIEITATPGGHNIFISAESPLLDPRLVATGANIRLEQLEKIPTARDPWAILSSTPGVLVDRVNVGLSETGEQPAILLRGSTIRSNAFSLDGINITDMADLGLAPRYFDLAIVDEIQTTTGGSDVLPATSGAGMNIVTKRGTNLFNGSGGFFFTSGGSIGDDFMPRGGSQLNNGTELIAQLGGPIARDKVFFFGAFNRVDTNREIVSGGELTDRDFTLDSALGKINIELGNHRLTGLGYFGRFDRLGEGAGVDRAPSSLWNADGQSRMFKFDVAMSLGSNLFMTAMAAYVDDSFTLATPGEAPTLIDPSGLVRDGFLGQEANRTSRQFRADLAAFTGMHDLRFGFGYRDFAVDSTFAWPGRMVVGAFPGDPLLRQAVFPPDVGVSAKTEYTSAYVQDTLTFGNLTANFGVRYDGQTGRNESSLVAANPLSPLVESTTFGGNDPGFDWHSLTPRLGLTYALGADRRTLLRASYSRFADQLGIGDILLLNPLATSFLGGSEGFVFVDVNNNNRFDPDEPRSGSVVLGPRTTDPAFLTTLNEIDPDYKSPMTGELHLGVDHLVGRGALSVHVQWRNRSDVPDRLDFVDDGGARQVATLAHFRPGATFVGPDLTGSIVNVETFELRPPAFYTGGVLLATGLREQRARNVTIQIDQRFVRGAYVRAWINFGNSEWRVPGDFFVDANDLLGSDDNDAAAVADQSASPLKPAVFINSNWSFELSGHARVPFGLDVGGRLYARQGFPAPVFVTMGGSDLQRQIQVREIDADRLGKLFIVDARVEKSFELGGRPLIVSADIFNLLNKQTVLQRVGDLASPFLGMPTELLSPRTFRLGARVRF